MRLKNSDKTVEGEKKNKRRGALLAIGFGVVGTGGVLASAASLGISTTGSLGTGVQVIATCDNDGVNVDYVTDFSTVSGKYDVVAVDITGIAPACVERTLKITLRKPVSGGGYEAVATGSRVLAEYDPITNLFTGHVRINMTIDPAYDSTQIDSAAVVIA